jgi:hypothetical protein
LLWAWFYRVWPRCLKVMVLVKPATVIRWHRQGFRKYWRWRSSSRRVGRPEVNREISELIRQMSVANPLWGAPRIHGEMLKLGIEVSQATVGRHMVRRHGPPLPTWRNFLRNQVDGIAAIDMFVVVTAAFRLLYVSVILSHARRKILHLNVTQHPTAGWLSRQMTEAFPWETAPRYLLRDRDASYGDCFQERAQGMGITEVLTAPRSPSQNSYVERVIGSIRRECLGCRSLGRVVELRVPVVWEMFERIWRDGKVGFWCVWFVGKPVDLRTPRVGGSLKFDSQNDNRTPQDQICLRKTKRRR